MYGQAEHALSPQQLFAWRRETRGQVVDGGLPPFVPILLEPGMGAAPPPAPVRAAPTVEIEVAGAVIRVRRGADSRTLAAVLRAVKSSA